MANKKISELDYKMPLSSDIIPVADPVTGVAGRSYCGDVVYAGMDQNRVIPTSSSFAYGTVSVNMTGNMNNLDLTPQTLVRISSAGNYDLTGIIPDPDPSSGSGRLIYIVNVGSNTVTFKNQDTASSAQNRFITHNGNNLSLPSGHIALAIYDGVASRWRIWSIV